MIKLISLGETAQKHAINIEPTNILRCQSQHASPEIKLGRKCKRTSTMQADSQVNASMTQRHIQQSCPPSLLGLQSTIKPEIGGDDGLMKLNLEAKEGLLFNSETTKTVSIVSRLVGIERQSPQKKTNGRQIVKLKHRKRKSHSPIDKLVTLLTVRKEHYNNV